MGKALAALPPLSRGLTTPTHSHPTQAPTGLGSFVSSRVTPQGGHGGLRVQLPPYAHRGRFGSEMIWVVTGYPASLAEGATYDSRRSAYPASATCWRESGDHVSKVAPPLEFTRRREHHCACSEHGGQGHGDTRGGREGSSGAGGHSSGRVREGGAVRAHVSGDLCWGRQRAGDVHRLRSFGRTRCIRQGTF